MNDQGEAARDPKGKTRIQSVSRAIEILTLIATQPEGMKAKAVAEACDLALPTTYHLLTTLWAEGMLSKVEGRAFKLGPQVKAIAAGLPKEEIVPASYRNALSEVVEATGETAYLGVWRNNTVEVIETVEGRHAVRVVGLSDRYTSSQLHARASGKLFLAFGDPELRESILGKLRLRPLTPHTITRRSDFKRELEQVRRTGVSFDREEFEVGVRCVSSPIFSEGRIVACITVSSPSQRYAETESRLIASLQSAIAKIDRRSTNADKPQVAFEHPDL